MPDQTVPSARDHRLAAAVTRITVAAVEQVKTRTVDTVWELLSLSGLPRRVAELEDALATILEAREQGPFGRLHWSARLNADQWKKIAALGPQAATDHSPTAVTRHG